ncbi:MAG: hypothetical protein HZB47_08140 [Nitrosomonadales bacterium]|nr:hypothetical protein [Nitrosomonadales bacterium]
MKTNRTIFKLMSGWMGMLAAVFFSPLSHAQDPATVTAVAVHYGGNIQYSYQVKNSTRARSIVSVSIGNRGLKGDDPVTITNEQAELEIYPAGSYWGEPNTFGDHRGESPRIGGIFSSPASWQVHIQAYDETAKFSVDWRRQVQTDPGILPGQTFNFGVTVPPNDDPRSPYSMSDPAYLAGHFTVGFSHSRVTDEGPAFWDFTGPIVSLDTAPPALAVTLTPSTLKPNEKLVAIAATISVTDKYDPAAEIRLESITSNEVLEHEDIQDTSFYVDDRSFVLRGAHKEGNKAGRIYTVTYSATDASGNKAIATATVTVPHDRGEHEGHHDEKDKKDKNKRDRDRQ